MIFTEITVDNAPIGAEVIGFSEEWVHEDFNPKGTRACWLSDDGIWTSAKWLDYHDTYVTDAETVPTHYLEIPSATNQNRYYAHITANYVAKNKAHADASEMAKEYNRKLIKSDEDLEKVKKEIEQKIASINERFPRIKHKVKLSISSGFNDGSETWYIGESTGLNIEPIKGDLTFPDVNPEKQDNHPDNLDK